MVKLFWVGSDENIQDISEQELKTEEVTRDEGQVALDIIETPYEIIIVAPIAGVDLDEIDISLNKSVLTMKWTRQAPSDIYHPDNKVRNSECFWWDFVRNVILPENLDFDTIKASMENNLLRIDIKKLKFSTQNIKIDRVEG